MVFENTLLLIHYFNIISSDYWRRNSIYTLYIRLYYCLKGENRKYLCIVEFIRGNRDLKALA